MIGLYQPRRSIYHALHPLTKLLISFGVIVVALGVAVDWVPLLVYVGLLIPLSVLAQVGGPFVRTTLRILLPFALSLFIIQGLFFPEGQTILARLGPLSIKAEGLRFAFASSVRILLIAGALVLTLQTTHPGTLMTGLTQKGVPPALTYVIVTTLQILPQMRDRADTIAAAQRSRGLETQGSFRQRVRGLLPLVGPLVLGALLDVEERSLALEARAFSSTSTKTSLVTLADPLWERVLRWLLLGVMVAILGFRLYEALS